MFLKSDIAPSGVYRHDTYGVAYVVRRKWCEVKACDASHRYLCEYIDLVASDAMWPSHGKT